ncbi:NHLP leader peptide family RiPP precursor [Paenibacillus sp. GCM10027627]|uniref:NHLP leader peptide family RiPP precursor n=1 Tax=unclassified Paenibacillus TaxID=185978 RepID=UPI003628E294
MPSEQQLREQIIEKAWADAGFKKQLLEDPKAAILAAFGIEVPANLQLKVLEETEDTYYLVLPQSPSTEDAVGKVENLRWV